MCSQFKGLGFRVWGLFCRLLKNLSLMQPPSVVYKAVFCVWLLSFHEGFPSQITETGILKATCEVLKESRVEKVSSFRV